MGKQQYMVLWGFNQIKHDVVDGEEFATICSNMLWHCIPDKAAEGIQCLGMKNSPSQ